MLHVHTILGHWRSGSYMCYVYVDSMAITRKDERMGYRPGGLHLGKFPTRYSSLLWRQDEPIIVHWDEPNVNSSWLKADLVKGRLKLTRYINDTCIWFIYILFNYFFICIWTLFRIPGKKITYQKKIPEKKISLMLLCFPYWVVELTHFFSNLFRWHCRLEPFLYGWRRPHP
jgi:hypothetical protein